MKVLFATDGSKRDQTAREFVERARWAPGTQLELFGVLRPAGLVVPGDVLERDVQDLDSELDELAISLPMDGCTVTWDSVIGEPAEMIAARARIIDADLIVVGSRGRGPLAASILGSVAAGVVDRAPCPVLVVRRPTLARVVLAEDGSPGGAMAAAVLQEWPIFGDASVEVLNVVDVHRPVPPVQRSGLYLAAEELYVESLDEERARASEVVENRAHELQSHVGRVTPSVLIGDPADRILAAAHDFAADLVVVGSRGQTGLTRFLTGSVARQVLLRAKCSVLIARGSAQVVRDRDRNDLLDPLARMASWSVATR